MNGFLISAQGAVSQGILWGIMVLGVYITYKLLNIADLTVDGSLALGGCVCAMLMAYKAVDPVVALLLATLAGMAAGAVTGFLHTVFGIPAILSGILTQIALWSVNLRIMHGDSNLSIKQMKENSAVKLENIFSRTSRMTGLTQDQATLVIGIAIAIMVITLLYWFFGTEIGSALRATGYNEDMVRALGINTKFTKLLALMISNGLVGLSGALICQSQRYGDISMGTGAIVIGLASIVIGDVLLGKLRSFYSKLVSAVLGSIVYYLILAVVLRLGMNANDMRLLSAVIVALALAVPILLQKYRLRKSYTEGGSGEC